MYDITKKENMKRERNMKKKQCEQRQETEAGIINGWTKEGRNGKKKNRRKRKYDR